MGRIEQTTTRYARDWDAFIDRLGRFTPKQRRRLQREGEVSGRLSMIVALSADRRATYSTADARRRLQSAQARITEERRLTRVPGTKQRYVDRDTKAMMPSPKLHRIRPAERHQNTRNARRFFARHDDRSLAMLQREQATSHLMWRVLYDDGPAPSRAELVQLQATFRSLRAVLPRKHRPAVMPVGMSADRALQIAIGVLERR